MRSYPGDYGLRSMATFEDARSEVRVGKLHKRTTGGAHYAQGRVRCDIALSSCDPAVG